MKTIKLLLAIMILGACSSSSQEKIEPKKKEQYPSFIIEDASYLVGTWKVRETNSAGLPYNQNVTDITFRKNGTCTFKTTLAGGSVYEAYYQLQRDRLQVDKPNYSDVKLYIGLNYYIVDGTFKPADKGLRVIDRVFFKGLRKTDYKFLGTEGRNSIMEFYK